MLIDIRFYYTNIKKYVACTVYANVRTDEHYSYISTTILVSQENTLNFFR